MGFLTWGFAGFKSQKGHSFRAAECMLEDRAVVQGSGERASFRKNAYIPFCTAGFENSVADQLEMPNRALEKQRRSGTCKTRLADSPP